MFTSQQLHPLVVKIFNVIDEEAVRWHFRFVLEHQVLTFLQISVVLVLRRLTLIFATKKTSRAYKKL